MNLNDFLNFTLQGFWYFVGILILIGAITKFIYNLYSRTLRHFSLMKHGYPPPYCDADGELLRVAENKKDEE